MAGVPVQDGPPAGGYSMVKTKRNLPKGGLSSVALALGGTVLFSFGMYKVVQANKTRREWRREEMDIRLALMPFLSAETDLQRIHVRSALNEKEAEIMQNVPNWEVGASVYKSRYMEPMTFVAQPQHSLFK